MDKCGQNPFKTNFPESSILLCLYHQIYLFSHIRRRSQHGRDIHLLGRSP